MTDKNTDTPLLPLPNEYTYWVIPGKLMAGAHPADPQGDPDATQRRLTAFLDAGVTAFCDLTEPGQRPAYADMVGALAQARGDTVEYVNAPFPDDTVPTTQQMKTILNALDGARARDETVYVHCAGGIGRTGTTIGCYLVRHGMSGTQALQTLNDRYQTSQLPTKCATSPATEEQKDYVKNWKE